MSGDLRGGTERWGKGRSPPRCTAHVFFVKDGMDCYRQCRVRAITAIQCGRFKNGHWDRPYPVCEEHERAWVMRFGMTEKRHVSLEDYRKWLRGEPVNLGCYTRKGKSSADADSR